MQTIRGACAWAIGRLSVNMSLIYVYAIVYFVWGIGMNEFGRYTKIANFTHWWQIITCYLLSLLSG